MVKIGRPRVLGICIACDSTETQIHNGKQNWHIHDGSRLCHKCYNKYVMNPVLNPINSKRNNPRKLTWTPSNGKQIYLKENPRKGICKWCGFEGCTHIHHIQYHDDDPLKDTVELCNTCHKTEHWRLLKAAKA